MVFLLFKHLWTILFTFFNFSEQRQGQNATISSNLIPFSLWDFLRETSSSSCFMFLPNSLTEFQHCFVWRDKWHQVIRQSREEINDICCIGGKKKTIKKRTEEQFRYFQYKYEKKATGSARTWKNFWIEKKKKEMKE